MLTCKYCHISFVSPVNHWIQELPFQWEIQSFFLKTPPLPNCPRTSGVIWTKIRSCFWTSGGERIANQHEDFCCCYLVSQLNAGPVKSWLLLVQVSPSFQDSATLDSQDCSSLISPRLFRQKSALNQQAWVTALSRNSLPPDALTPPGPVVQYSLLSIATCPT